jgi:putative oxidoreductase
MARPKNFPTGSNLRHALTVECGAMFPQLTQFADFSLLALRLMVGLVFITSGWSHVTKSDERSKSIGMSKGFTIISWSSGNGGSIGRSFRCLYTACRNGTDSRHAWRHPEEDLRLNTGFWGEKTYGWHYDLMLVMMNLVILFTNGGRLVLMK